MSDNKSNFQVVWGIALVMMGIMFFFRISQVIPEIEKIGTFSSVIGFVKFCLYFIAVMLTAGGGKKLYHQFAGPKEKTDSTDP